MNSARVVSSSDRLGELAVGRKRPSTATPRIVLSGVRSKMHALSAPVQRIEAWTIRWRSSWREALAEGLGHEVHEVDDPLPVLDRPLLGILLLPASRSPRAPGKTGPGAKKKADDEE